MSFFINDVVHISTGNMFPITSSMVSGENVYRRRCLHRAVTPPYVYRVLPFYAAILNSARVCVCVGCVCKALCILTHTNRPTHTHKKSILQQRSLCFACFTAVAPNPTTPPYHQPPSPPPPQLSLSLSLPILHRSWEYISHLHPILLRIGDIAPVVVVVCVVVLFVLLVMDYQFFERCRSFFCLLQKNSIVDLLRPSLNLTH